MKQPQDLLCPNPAPGTLDVVLQEARGFYPWPLGGAGGDPPLLLSPAAAHRAGPGLLCPLPSSVLFHCFSARFSALAAGPLALTAPGTARAVVQAL